MTGHDSVEVAGSDDARSAVLAALRAALVDVPASDAVDDPVERSYVRDRTIDDLVARLTERLRSTHADVTVCSPGEVAAAVAAALGKGNAKVDGSGPPRPAPVVCVAGLPQHWRCDEPALQPDDETADAAALAAFRAGVTGATVAIAETGTVVLDGGDLSGRRLLSLIPDQHICIVASSDIVADVPQALAILDPRRPRRSSPAPLPPSTSNSSEHKGYTDPAPYTSLSSTSEPVRKVNRSRPRGDQLGDGVMGGDRRLHHSEIPCRRIVPVNALVLAITNRAGRYEAPSWYGGTLHVVRTSQPWKRRRSRCTDAVLSSHSLWAIRDVWT